jgi:hypothetical protein
MLAYLLWSLPAAAGLPSVCAYLLVCRGSGAFAWIRSITMIFDDLLAEFTTFKGANSNPIASKGNIDVKCAYTKDYEDFSPFWSWKKSLKCPASSQPADKAYTNTA